MTKLTAMEPTDTLTEPLILVSGSKISNTAMGLNPGRMEQDTTVSIKTERKTEKDTSLLPTEVFILANLKKTKFLAKESIHGQTARYTKGNGLRTKCMV